MLYRGIKKEDENRTASGIIGFDDPFLQRTAPMTCQVDYLEDNGIVKVKTSGAVSPDDKKKISQEAITAGRGKNVFAFLFDQQESQSGLTVLEIDQIPRMLREIGFKPSDKMAILVNPNSMSSGLFKFSENVFYLSSLQIRIFVDTDEATSWLKTKA
jgi:hypothetical protein